jgi:hypothetical protein
MLPVFYGNLTFQAMHSKKEFKRIPSGLNPSPGAGYKKMLLLWLKTRQRDFYPCRVTHPLMQNLLLFPIFVLWRTS